MISLTFLLFAFLAKLTWVAVVLVAKEILLRINKNKR